MGIRQVSGKKRPTLQPFLVCLFSGVFSFVLLSYSQDKNEGKRINLLLITIDTLRPDRLGCYSSPHLKTPNIDSMAEMGTLFSRAFAHTPTTLASHANMLLGVTPLSHGVRANAYFVVRQESTTLAGYLKSYGYSSGAFVGGYPLDSKFGLGRDFDAYDDDFAGLGYKKRAVLERRAEVVIDRALGWLRIQKSPWFLWVHCYDPHDPYEPPPPFDTPHKKQPYDGEVAYVDYSLGKLLSYLKENNGFDTTLVILTGDHGESLGEHGELTHGCFAYNATLWVPLIIILPGGKNGRVDQQVSHIDLFPTVCDVLQIDKPHFLQGVSLLPAMVGKALPKRPIYFESLDPHYSKGWAPLRGFIAGRDKFIDSPIPEHYNLDNDFAELKNLAEKKAMAEAAGQLGQIVRRLSPSDEMKRPERTDREALEKLGSLGYVSASSPQDSKKDNFGPEDDVKVLLPFYNRALEAMDLYRKAKTAEAVKLLEGIIAERKDFTTAHYDLALIYKETGKLTNALGVLKKGLAAVPENYDLFFEYTSCLLAAAQHDEVIKMMGTNRFREMDYDPAIWLNLGVAHSSRGDLENGIAAYEKALAIDQKNATVHNNLGAAYYYLSLKTEDQRAFHKSVESFKKSIELDADYASPYDGLGTAYRLAGNLDGAIYCWEKALELEPDLDQVYYSLGLTYFDKGETPKALECLKEYQKRSAHLLPLRERKKIEELIQKFRQKL
jgi:arylsulfatase A-like enzyme/Tfp pilus assembly protein PilF